MSIYVITKQESTSRSNDVIVLRGVICGSGRYIVRTNVFFPLGKVKHNKDGSRGVESIDVPKYKFNILC